MFFTPKNILKFHLKNIAIIFNQQTNITKDALQGIIPQQK